MTPRSIPISAMGLSLMLCACDKEAELALRPSVANFAFETASFSEKDPEQDITIAFSKATTEAGSLSVIVTSDALDHFQFVPPIQSGIVSLDVPKGSDHISFKIRGIDNAVVDGDKIVHFALQGASRGLQVGEKNQLSYTSADDESPARIEFALEKSSLLESASTGLVITLPLSHAVNGDGEIEIDFTGSEAEYGKDFQTYPAAGNSKLLLPVQPGATLVSFVVDPLNDELFNADRKIIFNVNSVSDVFEKGSLLSHELTLSDDELLGKAKSYATSAGMGWSSKRRIYYALDGSIERVAWENETPGATTGEYLYQYNATGEIERVTVSSVTYIKYVRENSRIVKAEEYDNGKLDKYTLYGYDDKGNIGETAIYDRQSDGSFVFSLDFVFLYYTDGNLYKKLAYHPLKGGEPVLLTTDTYENYIDGVNPFPIEIILGKPIQHKLPTTYRHDTGDQVLEYSFSYEFLPGARPYSRTATGSTTRETTFYEYY